MATTTPSNELTLLLTQKLNKRGTKGRHVRSAGFVTLAGATTISSVFPFVRVPVDAIIEDVKLSSTDHGTTGAINIGLYPALPSKLITGSDLVAADAIDDDAFAAAVDIKTAAFSRTSVRFSARPLSTVGKKAWELAGLSAAPTTYNEFFIAGTLSTATDGAGDLLLEVETIVP